MHTSSSLPSAASQSNENETLNREKLYIKPRTIYTVNSTIHSTPAKLVLQVGIDGILTLSYARLMRTLSSEFSPPFT